MTERAQALEALIDKVESYNFECEGGPLRNCVDWHKLKAAVQAPNVPPSAPTDIVKAKDGREKCRESYDYGVGYGYQVVYCNREHGHEGDHWTHYGDYRYWSRTEPRVVTPSRPPVALEPPTEASSVDTLLRNIRMAAAMGLSFGHQATPQPLERMVERKDKRLRQILTLLAEHGVTGPMLRAESNTPVEPTPEPFDRHVLERDPFGEPDQPTGAPAPCVWRELYGGSVLLRAECCDMWQRPEVMLGWKGCPYCLKPLTVER